MKRRATLSAGVVVLRRLDNRWHYLVLRAYRNWEFPKGLVAPGEEPLDAALRETAEETDLSDLALRWGTDWQETEPYAGGKVARFYVAESTRGEVRLPINPELGRPEHHEFRWVELDTARHLLPPRLHPVLHWAEALAGERA